MQKLTRLAPRVQATVSACFGLPSCDWHRNNVCTPAAPITNTSLGNRTALATRKTTWTTPIIGLAVDSCSRSIQHSTERVWHRSSRGYFGVLPLKAHLECWACGIPGPCASTAFSGNVLGFGTLGFPDRPAYSIRGQVHVKYHPIRIGCKEYQRHPNLTPEPGYTVRSSVLRDLRSNQ